MCFPHAGSPGEEARAEPRACDSLVDPAGKPAFLSCVSLLDGGHYNSN